MMKLGLICLLSCVSVVNVTAVHCSGSLNATMAPPGKSDVIGSDKPIKVAVGHDVILTCHLEPPIDVRSLSVDWKHNETTVHIYRYRMDYLVDQDERFKGRTSLFCDEMAKGNISLKLTNVTEWDEGIYTCFVQQNSKNKRGNVTLIVVAGSNKGNQNSDTDTEEPAGNGTGGKIAIVVVVVGAIAGVCFVIWWIRKRNEESDVIGSDEPIKVAVGHDVILPCSLKPPIDVRSLTVVWERSGTRVHTYHYRMDDLVEQDEHFKDRTSLFYDEMAKGNISLKLTNVNEQDEGDYTCFVQQNSQKKGEVTLIVEPVDGSSKGNQNSDTDTEEPTGNGTGGKIGIAVGAIAGVCVVIRRRIRKIIGRDGTGNYEQTATS